MKFEDSPTMRALEKVAKEKGLVKPEPLQKIAAKPLDLTPGENLMENIFKLCTGLRVKGFVKEASELEVKYLNYKQAQTLYETSDEEGEDWVDAAHPDGSHRLVDVDGEEAVVETIIDKHKKDLEIAEKEPSGELKDASQIIQAVRTVLGQSKYQPGNLGVYVSGLASKAYNVLEDIIAVADKELSIVDIPGTERHISRFNATDLQEKFSTLLLNSPGREEIKSAQDLLDRMEQKIMPSAFGKMHVFEFLASGVSTAAWSKLQPQIEQVKLYLSKAIAALDAGKVPESELPKTQTTTSTTAVTHALPFLMQLQRLDSLISKVGSWAAIRAISQNPQATKWITDELTSLRDIKKRYSSIDKGQEENMAPSLKKDIDDEYKDIQDFANEWVTGRASTT